MQTTNDWMTLQAGLGQDAAGANGAHNALCDAVDAEVAALASSLRALWRSHRFDESALPEVAHRALVEHGLLERLDPALIVARAALGTRLPPQTDLAGLFGDPPVTLYRDHDFFVELHCWMSNTTTVHNHAFGGAFQVLGGSSLHSRYAYQARQRISSRMRVGELTYLDSERLGPGMVRRIMPGSQFIHSLFHLEAPSLTLLIRNSGEQDRLPNLSMTRTGVAFDAADDSMTDRRRRMLDLIGHCSVDDLGDAMRAIIADADLVVSFQFMRMAVRTLNRHRALWSELRELLIEVHGDVATPIVAALEEIRRESMLVFHRARIVEKGPRFLLALALNVRRKEAALRLIGEEFPGQDPRELVLEWITHLAERGAIAVRMDGPMRTVVARLLHGASDVEVLAAVAEEYGDAVIGAHGDAIARSCSKLRQDASLGVFFAEEGHRDARH